MIRRPCRETRPLFGPPIPVTSSADATGNCRPHREVVSGCDWEVPNGLVRHNRRGESNVMLARGRASLPGILCRADARFPREGIVVW